MPNLAVARWPVVVEMDLLTLMALHGYCCLALRHPASAASGGDVRETILRFVREAGALLVEGGLLTAEERAYVERVERAAGAR
jgi:hypothetical protein